MHRESPNSCLLEKTRLTLYSWPALDNLLQFYPCQCFVYFVIDVRMIFKANYCNGTIYHNINQNCCDKAMCFLLTHAQETPMNRQRSGRYHKMKH